jgi:predicted Zn-dependent protease
MEPHTQDITRKLIDDIMAAGNECDFLHRFALPLPSTVMSGLLGLVINDDELALVLSHEVGHNILNHIVIQKLQALGGAAAGVMMDILAEVSGIDSKGKFTRAGAQAGSLRHSVARERQADYVGLYVMARAGFNIEVAPQLWRRMAALMPRQSKKGAMPTHPAPPDRIVAMERTVTEIRPRRRAASRWCPIRPRSPASARIRRRRRLN